MQLKLAVSFLFSKEEPISIVAIDGTIICGNTFLKRQILENKEGGRGVTALAPSRHVCLETIKSEYIFGFSF